MKREPLIPGQHKLSKRGSWSGQNFGTVYGFGGFKPAPSPAPLPAPVAPAPAPAPAPVQEIRKNNTIKIIGNFLKKINSLKIIYIFFFLKEDKLVSLVTISHQLL